jgi:hypothetical protein
MSHCQLVVEEFCRRVLAMVVDGDERGGGRVIKIRRAAGINALRKYKCTNSYGDMSLSQSLPNGRFEIPNGDKAKSKFIVKYLLLLNQHDPRSLEAPT